MRPVPTRAPRRLRAAAVALVAALALPSAALAATLHGITPTSPAAGATVPKGKAVTFKGRVRGKGPVFIHVCKSARRSRKEGVICFSEAIGKATKKGGTFTYRQKAFAFDAYWLNRRGTYYWQAYRIACEGGNTKDCRQEGPVVKLRVR